MSLLLPAKNSWKWQMKPNNGPATSMPPSWQSDVQNLDPTMEEANCPQSSNGHVALKEMNKKV
jgi:hypothetical protein